MTKWHYVCFGAAALTILGWTDYKYPEQDVPKKQAPSSGLGQDQAQGWEPLARADGTPARPMSRSERESYVQAIHRTAEMVSDSDARRLAAQNGLQVLNLTWEDTGRYKGSSVGPNISDMTIQVEAKDGDGHPSDVRAMPVIRTPNYSDISTDIDPRDLTLLVGNQHGHRLQRVSLYDFLAAPTSFLSKPSSWLGHHTNLLASRDSKVLVSAQACFLPVPKQGLATFNPVLFNYESVSGDPAVLTILATREGTSTTIIDNKRDAFSEGSSWGQRLFHNSNGMRSSLTGQRESDYNASQASHGGSAATPGMSMVLLIQVPLKQRHPMMSGGYGGSVLSEMAAPTATAKDAMKRGQSDVESAIIGHGDEEGPFTEIDNLAIERDDRFPVRVTVQFYKATSNGVVSEGDMSEIKHQIDSVYAHGEVVGSLVTQGETGRPTEYVGCKTQPRDWWQRFWERNYENTGNTREEAVAKLRRLLGDGYERRPVSELYLRDMLRK